jgi:hypothetical protein
VGAIASAAIPGIDNEKTPIFTDQLPSPLSLP